MVSRTTFSEVNQTCKGLGNIWLQRHIDDFKAAGKLEVIGKTTEEENLARRLNDSTGGVYGRNDFLHAILAKNHADAFISDDLKFQKEASRIVKTITLREFLSGL